MTRFSKTLCHFRGLFWGLFGAFSTTLCLFWSAVGAIGKRLAGIFGFSGPQNSKSQSDQLDAFARWVLAPLGKSVLLIFPTISTSTGVSKTLRRFLSLRRDIHMCAHTRPYGAPNSKKSVLRLAVSRSVGR